MMLQLPSLFSCLPVALTSQRSQCPKRGILDRARTDSRPNRKNLHAPLLVFHVARARECFKYSQKKKCHKNVFFILENRDIFSLAFAFLYSPIKKENGESCKYPRRVDPSAFAFSLSSHRYSCTTDIYIAFSSYLTLVEDLLFLIHLWSSFHHNLPERYMVCVQF